MGIRSLANRLNTMGLFSRRQVPVRRISSSAAAGGGTYTAPAGQASSTTAIQAVSGMISRSLAASKVRVEDPRFERLIRPRLLAWTGRKCLLEGEACILYDEGQLVPADYHTWISPTVLELTFYNPTDTITRRVVAEQVALPFWEVSLSRYFEGFSPYSNPSGGVALQRDLEALLSREARSPHGTILWLEPQDNHPPQGAGETEAADIAGEQSFIYRGKGSIGVMTGGSYQAGPSPSRRGETTRFGYNPPQPVLQALMNGHYQVLSAAGVDPSIFNHNIEAVAGHRNFINGVAQPTADVIAAELSALLETDVTIDCSPSRQADDIQSRARAFNSLVSAGLNAEQAVAITGLLLGEEPDATEPVIPVMSSTTTTSQTAANVPEDA